jgi:hypothetical protein
LACSPIQQGQNLCGMMHEVNKKAIIISKVRVT